MCGGQLRLEPRGLVSQGVPDKKLVVVLLAFEDAAVASTPGRMFAEPTRESPLEILFFGQVTLVKGIVYLWEAPQLLGDMPVRLPWLVRSM